jgi:desulfoferrodoxin-like iron-binding protein
MLKPYFEYGKEALIYYYDNEHRKGGGIMLEDKDRVLEDKDPMTEHKDRLYKCDNCMRIVYLMEAGRGKDIECCDKKMGVMSEKEMKPYHPRFLTPGSP